MLKAAIFDMDGTLTDTERLYRETWLETAEKYGEEPSIAFTKAVCGSNGQEMMDIIHRFYPAVDSKQFMDDTLAAVVDKMEKDLPLKTGAKEIVQFLKENGLKLGVASSSKHAQIEKNMRKCGLYDFFDVFVGGDDVINSKPHPEIFQVSAEKMGVKPEECYVFEDGMNGLRSGLAAGCQVYMIVDLTPPDDEVAPQCAGVYDSFLEVMEILK